MGPAASSVVRPRTRVIEVLDQSLADGTDLYTQAKSAHWKQGWFLRASLEG